MDKIDDIRVMELKNSAYIKPKRLFFKQNGKERICEFMESHDSVSAVIHNITRDVLVFVRQFRPAVYYSQIPAHELASSTPIDTHKYPGNIGLTLELCAGIMDNKKLTPAETMREEILEECGYNVPLANIQRVTSSRTFAEAVFPGSMSVIMASVCTSLHSVKFAMAGIPTLLAGVIEGAMDELFFVEVTDDMKKTAGGGLEEQGEMIDVVELTRAEAKKVLFDDRIMKPAVLLFGVTWFLEVKSKQQKGLNNV